ncbi:MAG: endonuclease/exonuclease/phosphatase family protein [Clostridia bacterium]|nr:endonuclease/exonuclease/phosphatase family protein [Clostridia bacterium]
MKIRAMTFNIQHAVDFINGDVCPELTANTIRAFDPDFCVLNEVYGMGDGSFPPEHGNQTEIIAELLGTPHFAFCPAITVWGKPYGNAIISKNPILSCRVVPVPEPLPHAYPGSYYENRCVFVAEFEKYTVMGSHFGLAPDEQESAVKTVVSEIEKAEKPIILCGDFNMTPDNPTLSPIFRLMRDSAEVMEEPKLSFPSDKPEIRIDYIFVSPSFKICSADIPGVLASDHRPYIADLSLD